MAKRGRKRKDQVVEGTSGPVVGNIAQPSEFVGKTEFEEFKAQQSKNTLDILDAIKGMSQPTALQNNLSPSRVFSITKTENIAPNAVSVDDASAKRSNYTLNPAHQSIFEEYFDTDDGFEGRLEYPYFSIIVPFKFSNADPAWKKYYKNDVRLKFIRHDNIEGGIRDWCKLVQTNLKYNKQIKLK